MVLLSVTMNDGVIPRSEIEGKDNSSADKSNYKVVLMGDMVYNSMRMWQGANGISPYDGIVSPAYTVLMPKIPISNGYFAALFKSPNLINEFTVPIETAFRAFLVTLVGEENILTYEQFMKMVH